MSADGRFVAFGSAAANLVSTDVQGHSNIYVRDTCSGAATGCTPNTYLISLANDGSVGNCGSPGHNGGTSMSADGRFVAFGSIATNLTPDDGFPACGWEDIFVRDTCFGVATGCTPSTVRVSVANTPNPGTSANSINTHSVISADGHYVVFISAATNLTIPPTNGRALVFLAKTGF
jgi:Tol biopolymer transport system component